MERLSALIQHALSYEAKGRKVPADKISYNKIEIPRGGEYSLVLSDGTKVYLNAMSTLRFPVQFCGNKRGSGIGR